jgi:hypothetical protein
MADPFSFVWSLRLVQYFEGDNLFWTKKADQVQWKNGKGWERVNALAGIQQHVVSPDAAVFSHRTLRSEANPESPTAVVEKLSCSGMWKEGYKAGGLTKLIKP